MIVLWLLILRGIGVELRSHFELGIWQDFFDVIFSVGSGLLAFFFGVALANVICGVPLQVDHSFFLPLWTNFHPGSQPGILDWYTVLGACSHWRLSPSTALVISPLKLKARCSNGPGTSRSGSGLFLQH